MPLLLDTQVLLWALVEPDRLGAEVRAMVEAPDNEVMFSAASIWEIAIKAGLGRTDFVVRLEGSAHAGSCRADRGDAVERPAARASARVLEGIEWRNPQRTWRPKAAS